MNKMQGYVLIALSALILVILVVNITKSAPKYQYKVVSVQAQFKKGAGLVNSDLGPTQIGVQDEELSLLGKDGWELVDTMVEVETTHPNFGNSEYVTGLQPNIRPQRAVMIFRKAL